MSVRRGRAPHRGAACIGLAVLAVMAPTLPRVAAAQGGAAPPVSPSAAAQARPRHTEADVRFMQGMLHHHAQAIAMAALVPARTTRADLRALSARIDVSQVDEIAAMKQWLVDHGAHVPEIAAPGGHDGHAGHGTPTVTLMPGMLTAEQMTALANATGPAFERLFLAGMIQHHEGALVMVRELFATPGAGQETAIFSFATDVDADQRAEIARMRRLLAALGTR